MSSIGGAGKDNLVAIQADLADGLELDPISDYATETTLDDIKTNQTNGTQRSLICNANGILGMGNPLHTYVSGPVNILDFLGNTINPATEDTLYDMYLASTYLIPAGNLEGGGKNAVGTTQVEVTFTGTPRSIIIQADVNNTGLLFIGKTGVTNAGANAFCFLEAGKSMTIDYIDNFALYVISDTAGQYFWKGALL